jgi:hypothetical protein
MKKPTEEEIRRDEDIKVMERMKRNIENVSNPKLALAIIWNCINHALKKKK